MVLGVGLACESSGVGDISIRDGQMLVHLLRGDKIFHVNISVKAYFAPIRICTLILLNSLILP